MQGFERRAAGESMGQGDGKGNKERDEGEGGNMRCRSFWSLRGYLFRWEYFMLYASRFPKYDHTAAEA